MKTNAIAIFSFECRVTGDEHGSIINERSAGRARYQYWLDVRDCCPDLRLIDIRVRKLGAPVSSNGFLRTAAYRGLPGLRCGDRVRVGAATGVIVANNSSANFDVLFDEGEHAGLRMNVHPAEMVIEAAA